MLCALLTLSHLQTHLQQTTFENIMAKGEIAHDEQFPLFPQCFQLYLMIKLSFMELFHIFAIIFSKSSAAELSYVEMVKENLTLFDIAYFLI